MLAVLCSESKRACWSGALIQMPLHRIHHVGGCLATFASLRKSYRAHRDSARCNLHHCRILAQQNGREASAREPMDINVVSAQTVVTQK